MKKTVRLIDIGNALGVSAVTVSNALSNQKGVSDELREKIIKKAEEMGYTNHLNNAKREAAFNVGVVIYEGFLDKFATFYWDIYQKMSIKAMEKNCVTIVEIVKKDEIRDKQIPIIVRDNKVQALMILGEVSAAYVENIKLNTAIPVVFVDFYKKSMPDVDCVISNNYYGSYLITNEVIKRGHRDIVFVGTVNATDSITDRYFGFLRALIENDIPIEGLNFVPDRELGGTEIKVELPEHIPSAFVCNCDLTAAKIVRLLENAGYKVPEDVSVVGFDNYIYPGLSKINFTTYDVNTDEMINIALDIAVKRITGEQQSKPRMYITCGRVVEGESLAPKKEIY